MKTKFQPQNARELALVALEGVVENGAYSNLQVDQLLKKYPFPVFENEKFMSEGWLWRTVAKRYKTIYRAKCIYVCEYLEGGLTKCGRGLRMSCPQGMLENCRTFFVSEMNIKIQIKEMLLYDIYADSNQTMLCHSTHIHPKAYCTLVQIHGLPVETI